jgi:hypothetical protein
MADLIPTITFTEFKKLKPDQLRRLKCCEVTFNTEYLFTFVNGNIEQSGYLKVQTEYNSQTANAVGGETLEDILEDALVRV